MSATTGTDSKAMTRQTPGDTLVALFKNEAVKAELAKVATAHLTPERLLRLMVGEIRRVPKLQDCTQQTLMACVLDMMRLGLEPGPLGHAYLVPYGNVCTLILGYRGLLELARRSGQIQRVEAHVVYEKEAADPEHWQYEAGLTPKLIHRPLMAKDRGPIVAAYMVAQLKDGSTQVEVMSIDEIEAVRARSKSSKSGPWVTDFAEMCRKTVVRRGSKYLPLAAEDWRRALELDREDFDTGDDAKPERKPPASLRAALGMAGPERDEGAPPSEPDADGVVDDRNE